MVEQRMWEKQEPLRINQLWTSLLDMPGIWVRSYYSKFLTESKLSVVYGF